MKIKFSHTDVVYDHGAPLFADVGGVNRNRIWFTPEEDLMLIDYDLHKAGVLSYITHGISDGKPLTAEQAINALSQLKHCDMQKCEYVPVEVKMK